jgi:hypothetical protein
LWASTLPSGAALRQARCGKLGQGGQPLEADAVP